MDKTLPLNWPPLREAAEGMAMEHHCAWAPAFRDRGGQVADWLAQPKMTRDHWSAAHASLLTDLSRPASRDHWARWLAERVGLVCGATAPGWNRVQTYVDHESTNYWALSVPGGRAYEMRIAFFHEPGDDDDGATVWRVAPGISALTNPAEALRLACLSVVPA